MRTASAKPPDSALFIRPDAIGDLVLFSPVLRCFRSAWPKARIGVVVRPAVAGIGGWLAPGVEWLPTSLDPYVSGPVDAGAELGRLRAEVARFAPELLVAACSRRHWLDAALAAVVPNARRVAFGSAAPDPYYEVPLHFELKADTVDTFQEILPAAAGPEEWKRNFGLASSLLGRTVKPSPPVIELGPEILARADEVLGRLKLEPGQFVSCAAAGFSNVFLKTWPEERFAETIRWLWKERGRRSLLVGQATERDYLGRIAEAAGDGAAEVWTGAEGDLGLLAGLLARAGLHFGNDTGAVHLAAAAGTFTVTIFGGGTWPRFVPASDRAISLVHPLPCFGCGWDCAFGDAPCVKRVGAAEVRDALDAALDRLSKPKGAGRGSRVIELSPIGAETAAMMGRAAAVSRERSSAHRERERKLQEIGYLSREKDVEIRLLKAAADEKDAEISMIARAAEERRQIMERSHRDALAARDASEAMRGELKAIYDVAEERRVRLEELHRACAGLQRVCDERLASMEELARRVRELEAAQAPPR